ncbi:DNA polymerase I, partial [Patescibacteria group bacterium]|nr:DNA polymerase I [Patescibacteria group bacterium]
SDNIPGIRGIGDKTAVSLLQAYDSLENLYSILESGNTGDIKDSVLKKLIQGKKDAFMSQNLCRIRCNVNLDFKLKDAEYQPVTREMVKDVFEHYQFNRLLTQLPKASSEEDKRAVGQIGLLEKQADDSEVKAENSLVAPDNQKDLPIISDISSVRTFLTKMIQITPMTPLVFKTLTEGISYFGSKIQYLAVGSGSDIKVIAGSALSAVKTELQKLFGDVQRELICYNLKQEISTLVDINITIAGRPFDLMIASYLLHAGERRHNLSSILSFHFNISSPEKDLTESEKIHRLLTEVSHFTSLASGFSEQLNKFGLKKINDELEVPLSPVLSRIEKNGVRLDIKYLQELSIEVGQKIDNLTKKIYQLAGQEFNINSPGQLKEVLFDKLGLSVLGIKKTEKGKTLSTAASELEKICDQHEIISLILDYRELAKLKSTYIDALPPLVDPKTNRIHADFNQTVTATGRLSSSNPNLQNIPTASTEYGRKVRDAFIAENGYTLLAADYSQIELRIAAHIAKEEVMIKSFHQGEDIHWRTAAEMFGEDKAKENRRIAKAINFGILYGMGPQRLAASANISLQEARNYIETYFALHSGIEKYICNIKQQVAETGYVETIFGRKRFFPNFHLLNLRERAEAERQAVNMPIQGTSADIIKKAMIMLDRNLTDEFGYCSKARVRMILQVHDELVFEVKKDLVQEVIPIVRNAMEDAIKLSVPIVVDFKSGQRWGSMKELD